MDEDLDPRFAAAGFGLPNLARWSDFVAGGALARMLTHVCLLVKPSRVLGYRLIHRGDQLVLTLELAGESRDVPIAQPTLDDRPLAQVTAVLHAINEHLAETGLVEQLVLVEPPREAGGYRYRVLLVDPRVIPANHALGWYVDKCLIAPVTAPTPLEPGTTLAAIPSVVARAELRFDEDGSLLGLVAAYVERLAKFAGVEGVTVQPHWTQEPDSLAFTFAHRPATGGGLQTSVRLPRVPELDLQPMLDTLNRFTPLSDGPRHLYRVADHAERLTVALLDKPVAAEFRRTGDLIEHPAKQALRALADAGFELSALSGKWEHYAFALRTTLARLALLAKAVAEVAVVVEVEKDGSRAITWTVNGRISVMRYAVELGKRDAIEVLPMIVGDLNRLLATAGCEHRAIVMSGAPYFYAHRMLLLDREWLAQVAWCREVADGCLDDATRAQLERIAGAFPVVAPAAAPPRLPRIDELLRRENIQDNDFKCSARPHDFIDLIEEIARFARIAVAVDHQCIDEGEHVVFTVTYRGTPATIRLENTKYANVAPVLDYVNALLDGREPRHQLYYFRAGGYESGIVRATDEEADQLRSAGYIS